MARNLFRYGEIPQVQQKVILKPPFEKVLTAEEIKNKEEEELKSVEVYDGPSIDDIKNEIDEFKAQFEIEKKQMMSDAKDEADLVFGESQQKADALLLNAEENGRLIIDEAEEKAKKSLADGRKKLKDEKSEIHKELDNMVNEATSKGNQEGRDLGFGEGKKEVERLISKIHIIIGGVVEKRKEILEDSEAQVIELVLQISNKVVKAISENEKEVVVRNVKAALAKVKSRTDIIIRVNLEDVDISTSKMKEFLNKVEKVKNITVLEDATVSKGGCIVETDFGHIDARISSQLREIETKIRELAPIKTIEG